MLITASFGYSMWKDFKDNYKWSTVATEAFSLKRDKTENINENINHTITEQRDVKMGFDPSEPKLDPNHKEP
jgi:hypothetical protein